MRNHKDLESVEYIKPLSRNYYDTKPQNLWWPFWAWRIIAPEEADETDVFQELILRLIKAGAQDRVKLEKYSCLHSEFVIHLIAILEGKGLLQGWELTEKGEKAVVDGYQRSDKVSTYYLLQDADSGKLVPRVFRSLSYIDNVTVDKNKASYLHSRGSGRNVRPYILRTSRDAPIQPSVDEVYDSIRSHRLDRNRLSQAGLDSDAMTLYEDQIELLDDDPFPVYMHLQLFTELGGERPWYISDPTNLLPSLDMLNRVADNRRETDKFFAERVDELLGISIDKEANTYDDVNMQIDEKIKAQLIMNYSWVSHFPQVEKYVLLMLKDKQVLECAAEKAPWMRERLVSSIQLVCESIVKMLSPPDEKNEEWKKVHFKDEWNNRRQIKDIYLQCDAVDDQLAFNFSKIRSGQIKVAMKKGDQSLRQLLAAMVLIIPQTVMEIERSIPGWLNRAMLLGESRNKAEHANDQIVGDKEVSDHIEFIERLLNCIEGSVVNG